MIRCILCDDREEILCNVKEIVSRLFREEGLEAALYAYSDMQKFMTEYSQNPIAFDLAVLDLEMPRYNGIAIAKELRRVNPDCMVMVLTSHVESAVDLYEAEIYRFLPKHEMVYRLEKYMPQACHVLRQLAGETVLMQSEGAPVKIKFRHVVCILKEKQGKYCRVFFDHQEPVRIRLTLTEIMQKLPGDQFCRPERSALVNLAFVERMEDRCLWLHGGRKIDISRGKEVITKEKIARFWGERI